MRANARHFLVVVSMQALDSDWVPGEIEIAVATIAFFS